MNDHKSIRIQLRGNNLWFVREQLISSVAIKKWKIGLHALCGEQLNQQLVKHNVPAICFNPWTRFRISNKESDHFVWRCFKQKQISLRKLYPSTTTRETYPSNCVDLPQPNAVQCDLIALPAYILERHFSWHCLDEFTQPSLQHSLITCLRQRGISASQ